MASLPQITGLRDKWIPSIIGIIFSLLLAILLFFHVGPLADWVAFINDKIYDFQLRRMYQPLSSQPDVVIVGLDDKSLKVEGRLPWDRKKMADLVDRLNELGAKVIAFDFMFPTPQENIAATVLQQVEKKGGNIEARGLLQDFDSDALFAQSLAKVDAVLGMALTSKEESLGVLPPPLLLMDSETASIYLPEKTSYLGNIPLLQKAAKSGGFINNTPDRDSVTRFSPLVYRLDSAIFGSLALMATIDYLKINHIKLEAKSYGESKFLEAIELDHRSIPVDPLGRILVPYRGPAHSFPFLSASDVLNGQVSAHAVRGKLVFVGATATGSGDLVASPISQSFNGVEVHASIAQGIIDHYLPYKPGWEKGVSVVLILAFGLSLALFLPRMGPFPMIIFAVGSMILLLTFDYWIWHQQKIVLSLFFPLLTIGVVFLFNLIYGFVKETKWRKTIKNVFGLYVSSEYVDEILKKGGKVEMSGESKELSVLFADIRGFTTLSEGMNAKELTSLLTKYFTIMSEVVFLHRGTIDKFIGDAIMAFWGAPLPDLQHADRAVSAALEMQQSLERSQLQFVAEKRPGVKIGIGIATGEMYVGDMGSKFRRSYTVIGDTVNLSSRLEGLTKYYGVKIIVSENTYMATRDRYLYRKLDKVRVKGKQQTVLIFEPLCFADKADGQLQQEVDLHNRAHDAYTRGDWEQARQHWQQLQKTGTDQAFYTLYLARMQTPSPPSTDWDAVQEYEKK